MWLNFSILIGSFSVCSGLGGVGLHIPPGQISLQESNCWQSWLQTKLKAGNIWDIQVTSAREIGGLDTLTENSPEWPPCTSASVHWSYPSITSASCLSHMLLDKLAKPLLFHLLGILQVIPQFWHKISRPIKIQLISHVWMTDPSRNGQKWKMKPLFHSI